MSTISTPAAPALSLPMHRFTVAEYQRLVEVGVLTEDHKVELLEGQIVEKLTPNPPHSVSVQLCNRALSATIPTTWHTRAQNPITTADSQPEPDLAVVRGDIRDYAQRHPTGREVCLVIEVAETSLVRDHYKRSIYARAGIASHWIVNLEQRKVEFYEQPTITENAASYKQQREYTAGQLIPLLIEGLEISKIAVNDLI